MDARSVSVSLPVAGMISYTYDNYEGWTWEQVTEDFTQKYQSSYQSITLNMQEIQSGAPLYRLITGQSWYVTFFTDVEEAKTYKKRSELDFYIDQEKLSGTVISSEEQNGRLKVVLGSGRVSGGLFQYENRPAAVPGRGGAGNQNPQGVPDGGDVL